MFFLRGPPASSSKLGFLGLLGSVAHFRRFRAVWGKGHPALWGPLGGWYIRKFRRSGASVRHRGVAPCQLVLWILLRLDARGFMPFLRALSGLM